MFASTAVVVPAVLIAVTVLVSALYLHDTRRLAETDSLSKLKAETSLQAARRDDLERDISEKKAIIDDFASKQAEKTVLEADLDHLRERKLQLEAAVAAIEPKNVELAQISSQLEKERERLKDLESEAANLRIARAEIQADINGMMRERQQLSDTNLEHGQRLETLSADIAQRRVEASEAQAVLEGVRGEIARTQSSAEELQRRVVELEIAARESEARRSRMEHDCERLRTEVARLDQTKTECAGALKLAQSDQSRLTAEIGRLQADKQAREASLQDLSDRIVDTRETLEDAEARLQALRSEAVGLENRLKDIRSEIDRTSKQLEGITTSIAEAGGERARLMGEVGALRAERESLSQDLARLLRETEMQRSVQQALLAEASALERRKLELENEVVALGARRADRKQDENDVKREVVLGDLLKTPSVLEGATQRLSAINEREALQQLKWHLKNGGLTFSDRLVNAFHTSLKIADISPLTVLAGISGTGKSELPRRYAEAMGLPFLQLAVQPRWDSPQDLFGFYNYIEGRYKPTELVRAMVHLDTRNWPEQAAPYKDHMMLVLLDEMNLARVEYYFSEFLSRLETRRGGDHVEGAAIELDFGGRPLGQNKVYPVSRLLFIGTMNEDESTQTLSDKVVDRANVLRFPKPTALKSEAERLSGSAPKGDAFLPYDVWRGWHRDPSPSAVVQRWLNALNEAMGSAGRPFGHRMARAIAAYIANYPQDRTGGDALALADQLEMRLFPKLRGVDTSECGSALDSLESFIKAEIGDEALLEAFKASRGAEIFAWRGLDRV